MPGFLDPANVSGDQQDVDLVDGHAGFDSHEWLVVKQWYAHQNYHGERDKKKIEEASIDTVLKMFTCKE